jgi:hypothetical protein
MIGTVGETIYVEWLPSTAAVWRRPVIEKFGFEEYFEGYSYLEDLDFSYGVSRHFRLAVAADAGFFHHHSPSGRIGMYAFGRREVANRLFFVRKHGLSVSRCYLAFAVRLLMTVWSSLKYLDGQGFLRAFGNCIEIVRDILFGQRRSSRGTTGAKI